MVTIDRITEKVKQRFWAKVQKGDGCWEWTGGKRSGKWPYGKFRIGKHTIGAHVASWVIHFGLIPDGLDVCHECDNPSCVRPDHLWLGTQGDNTRDAKTKGRLATPDGNTWMRKHPEKVRGEHNPMAKITEEEAKAIRKEHDENGLGYIKLARKFGLSWGLVRAVVSRRSWKHVA